MRSIIIAFMLFGFTLPAFAEGEAWVTVDRLNRRTCPASSCGSVGILMFREKATVLEEKNGWARVTRYYDAACENGISGYVDRGNKKCKTANGIKNGTLAEWVFARYLSASRPADPAANASKKYSLVKGSDDFRTYKNGFAKAASELIASGRCTAAEFREMGGWIKSSSRPSQPIYFTYCGGMRKANKVYLNAATGKIQQ